LSACKSKFEPALQEQADKILHDLPEELAATLTFSLHEGGDMLLLKFPPSLHGTEEMQTLDRAAKSHGAAFVSREGLGAGHYLVPKAKLKLPAAAANEATAQREADTAIKQPQNSHNAATSQPQAKASSTPEPQKPVPQPESQPQLSEPKQPSPVAQFTAEYCMLCENTEKCDITTPEGKWHRAYCLQIQDLKEQQRISSALTEQNRQLSEQNRIQAALNANLEKLANRPAWKGGGKPQPKETRVEGGIRWFWTNDKQEWEKASDGNNQASKEYTELKTKVEAAVKADKKGTEIDGFWVMPDGFQKDGIIRKKLPSAPDNKGGKT